MALCAEMPFHHGADKFLSISHELSGVVELEARSYAEKSGERRDCGERTANNKP